MHHLILWAGFVGAWLLVAGPVFQASIELREEEFERERFGPLMAGLEPPDRLSPLWWLLPPVHLYLSRRRKEEWQRTVIRALPDEEYAVLTSFMSKARGWILVGTGGLFIASKETWELVEGNEWPTWLFWLLMVVMTLVALGNAVVHAIRQVRAEADRAAVRAAAQ